MSGVKSDAKTKKAEPKEEEISEETNQAPSQPEMSDEERRDKRFQEWGDQFDIWLIRAAKKRRPVECIMAEDLSGITQDGKVLQGIPLRVDKHQVQFLVNDDEVWVNRSLMVTAKHLGQPTATADSK